MGGNDMTIREAAERDLQNIGRLCMENWKKTYAGLLDENYLNGLTPEDCAKESRECLEDEKARLYVAYEGDTFLGFGAGLEDKELKRCFYLASLHVSEAARGKGVGTALLREIGRHARHGYGRMSVCIVQGNDGAKRLYERLGAAHYKYFEDDFHGTKSQSEKLVWEDLERFA